MRYGLTMIVLAGCYVVLVAMLPTLTGAALADGVIGIVLGLYICSHPASAAVDMLYLDRLVLQQLASEWSDLGWLGLNLLVLVAGCVVTIIGATAYLTKPLGFPELMRALEHALPRHFGRPLRGDAKV